MVTAADPMAGNIPHVKAEWMVQGGLLLCTGKCSHCGADFGLTGEADYLASGDAKHWCRCCHRFMRVTATGSKPEVPPLPVTRAFEDDLPE